MAFLKYKYGYARKGIYMDLNSRWKNCKLPDVILSKLDRSINYGKVKKISVIVYTRNRIESLKKYSLKSLGSINFSKGKFEVVIVDNSSDDDTWNYLQSVRMNNLKLVRERRKGICRALNKGIKESDGNIVAFLEDDMAVDNGWLKRIAMFHNSNGFLLGQGLVYDTRLKKILNKFNNLEHELNFLDGNMSYRKDVFRFASFNESIIYGGEGYDLMSQIFVLWPNFRHYLDNNAISHYRQPSEFRDKIILNKKGYKTEVRGLGLWFVGKHILRRNLDVFKKDYFFRFWLKEILFMPIELSFVYGDAIALVRTKRKIYRQLKRLEKLI